MTRFHEKTSAEVQKIACRGLILPVGSIEQHGPHLPLDTDAVLVGAMAEEVSKRTGLLVLPTLAYGVSVEHMDFPGTVTLRPETLKWAVRDIAESLRPQGFMRLHIVNHHGGNRKHLEELLPELNAEGLHVCLHSVLGRVGKFDHAGEVETSLMLYLFPDRVRKDRIRHFNYTVPEGDDWRTVEYAKEGVIGDAEKASAREGETYFKRIVVELVKEIKDEERE